MRLLSLLLLLGAMPVAAATERVGSLDGVAIIDRLDVADLPMGRVDRFWFRAGENQLGQDWRVPVIVIRGARPGPRLLLTAAIHGDELNGIDVIHQLVAGLDPSTLSGTIIAVPGLNTPGLLQSHREWTPDDSRSQPNLNRVMPGDDGASNGSGGVDDYAGRLWSRLIRPNADQAVDMHTQSRGTAYVLYAFASTPRTRTMAELMAPDIVKLDRGDKGTVENELTNAGVPAITLELGGPEEFNAEMVRRGVAGITNLMRDMKMLAGPATVSSKTFVANSIAVVRAPRAGFAHLLVPLGAAVAKDQPVATISDAFGRITETVKAPMAGRVNTIATDPRRARGGMLLRIVWWSADPQCAMGC